ncbi:MAG: hypothetical protein HS126_08035 [Anaerolineales bacterium]|nr:hypothetical protein [Anaerolineales bacterium]
MKLAQVFQGVEHQSFTLTRGASQALLVHGFPGTPAEMRPLPGPLRYEEVLSGHYMIHPDDAGWSYLEQAVLQFAGAFQL